MQDNRLGQTCRNQQAYRASIIEWTEILKPDYFVTINFHAVMPLDRVEHLLFATNKRILRRLFKRSWSKKKSAHPVWIACHERTKQNYAHVHMLVHYPEKTESTWATYHNLWHEIGKKTVGHRIGVQVLNIEPGTSPFVARYATKEIPDITCSPGCPPFPVEF